MFELFCRQDLKLINFIIQQELIFRVEYMKFSNIFRCHLPMLYIGLEYGLTNNSKLAERFFGQALSVAPEDPFVMHEVGVVAFQNGE